MEKLLMVCEGITLLLLFAFLGAVGFWREFEARALYRLLREKAFEGISERMDPPFTMRTSPVTMWRKINQQHLFDKENWKFVRYLLSTRDEHIPEVVTKKRYCLISNAMFVVLAGLFLIQPILFLLILFLNRPR